MTFGEPKIDLDKLRAFKDSVVQKLTGGLGQVAKLRKVTYIQGTASFVDATTLQHRARRQGGTETLDVRARDHRDRLAAGDGARASRSTARA